MANTALIRTLALAAMALGAVVAVTPTTLDSVDAAELRADARAQVVVPSSPLPQVAAGDGNASFVPLGISKSVVIDLPADVKDVLVADPKIANAVIRSARRAYLIGVSVGQTSVYFFDAQGRQIAGFDIAVT